MENLEENTLNEEEVINSIINEIGLGGDNQNENVNQEAQNPEETQVDIQNETPAVQPQQQVNNVQDDNGIKAQTELLQMLVQNQNALAEQNKVIQEKLSQQPQQTQQEPQLSEEELAMQELKQRMGLDSIEAENKALKEQLAQVQQFIQQQQDQQQQMEAMQQHQAQIMGEVNRFKQDFPDADEDAIADYIEKQPAEFRGQISNYNGWAMIHGLLKSQAQPTVEPDQILNSQSVSVLQKKDTTNMTSQERDINHAADILKMIGR